MQRYTCVKAAGWIIHRPSQKCSKWHITYKLHAHADQFSEYKDTAYSLICRCSNRVLCVIRRPGLAACGLGNATGTKTQCLAAVSPSAVTAADTVHASVFLLGFFLCQDGLRVNNASCYLCHRTSGCHGNLTCSGWQDWSESLAVRSLYKLSFLFLPWGGIRTARRHWWCSNCWGQGHNLMNGTCV